MEPGGRFSEERVRIDLEDGYVLHRRAHRETSLLVDVFTARFGRFRLLAKGARRNRGEAGPLLQPFRPLRLSWTGRGSLPVLTAIEANGPAAGLAGTPLFCGFYINELLLHLVPEHDAQPEVFQLYCSVLADLCGSHFEEGALRDFELSLLDQLGYGLALDSDSLEGKPIDPQRRYVYLVEQGPVPAEGEAGESVSGATLSALRSGLWDDPRCLHEAKRLMRRVIHHHLNGRPLKSRELFKYPGER